MRRASFLAVVGLLASSVALAEPPPSNGYIGVFGDVEGTQCNIVLNKSGNGKLYVYAVTGGASAAGISGAEFKVAIEPPAPDAVFHWTPASGVDVNVGQPADNGSGGGATLAFKGCQTQTGLAGDRVLLGTFFAINLTDEHRLVVRAHDAPSNATFACPSVLLCDAPAYTQVCLTLKKGDSALGGEDPMGFISAVNATSTAGTSCGFVATEQTSWSSVKGLFR